MQTDRLEDFIKANREEFDFREPAPEVWENIVAKNKKSKVVILKNYLVRIAAVITIAIVASAVLFQTNILGTAGIISQNIDPDLKELLEAEAFYAHRVDSKLKEIRKCYFTFPELKEEVETDLNELEDMYQILKTDLKDNVSNKTVIEAMIENNRYRLKLVDDVLEQIKC
jgi:hypothetical protein